MKQNQNEPKSPITRREKTSIVAKHMKKPKDKVLHLSRSNSVTDVERDTLINRVEPEEAHTNYNDLIAPLYDQTKAQ